MPSTYAHYRFGQEVLKELPNDIKKIIIENKELYDIGLHGPDLLFYYLPLKTNEINSIGYNMHEKTGEEVFDTFRKMMTSKKQINHYLAYYYGFICHFALDATCHGYIEKRIHESGVSHGEIEVEFDRFLMIEDGLNPISHHLTNHLVASEENAKIIADFYEITTKQTKKAIKGMKIYNDLLVAPSKLKRKIIYALLRISGNYKEMHGLLVNYRANPLCNDSTDKLYELYESAKQLAVTLISEFRASAYGRIEYNKMYNYTFGSKLVEENVHKASETQIKNQTNNNTEDNAKTVIQYTVSNELENNADGDESDNADGSSRKCG